MSSSITINTNLASLNAQRRLGESTAELQQSFERLSSGLRINKASDDAAGLAIASSLNVDTRVFTEATRNTNDAISLYSIAEGSLTSLVDITTRLKELAQESSNGTLTNVQRKALDSEAQALGKEYQRIINTTQFNGQNLINGTGGPLSVQVGYNALSLSGGNAPTGTFATPQTYAVAGGFSAQMAATSDLNGDGAVDLVTVDDFSNQITVFLGNGNGTFRAAVSYATSAVPKSAAIADFNGDGIQDLISSDQNGNQVSVFIGNGNGTFKAEVSYATGPNPQFVTTADVNGDGIVDVAATLFGGQMVVLVGNGNGSFKAAQTYTTAGQPQSITAADINGDGNLDLISADRGSNQLSLYLGNGDGTFQAKHNLATGTQPYSVTNADVNGDGIVDLISADSGSNQFSVFLGIGNGTFQAAQTYVTGSQPLSVNFADINGDGIGDLISADSLNSKISVLLGNADGTFKARQSYSIGAGGSNPISVTSADVNGDGAVDIVSADANSADLSIFLGNSAAQAVVAPTTGFYSLLTQQSARQALTQFGVVLNRLTASLGQLGANESRLQTVNKVLNESQINYASAASQILDADVATEAANLTKNNILQQAGAAVLAQANQQPALAIRLLQSVR